MPAYLRFPTILDDEVVFAAEDDLWMVPAGGGRAFRLTAGVAEAGYPRFSPRGDLIAFVGGEEGPEEVYVMPADGGAARRVTYHGARSVVAGWDPAGAIVYASDEGQPFTGQKWLHRVEPDGVPERLPYGPANSVSYGPRIVLGRNTADPARWKRYRGGTVGDLWIQDRDGERFQRLISLPGNLASPCWAGERIHFISDHEGVGNVYSCTADGGDLRRHSDHADFYARNLSGDGRRLVYHAGAALYLVEDGESHRIDVRLRSSRTQRNRRFAPAEEFLDGATLSPDGSALAVTTHGKAFSFAAWEGPVRQHGAPYGVRYRMLTWLNDGERLVAAASDDGDREVLVILTADGSTEPVRLDHLDTGRVTALEVSPVADLIAVANHRNELILVDLRADAPAGEDGREGGPTAARGTVADVSGFGAIEDLAWSPDGRWLAYACPVTAQTTAVKLCRAETGETFPATRPVLWDGRPAFDPAGDYLYFIGRRVFNPVYDELQFDLGFPLGSRPYAVALRADVRSPFVPLPRPLKGDEDDEDDEDTGGGEDGEDGGPREVVVDPDGICDRIVAFPVPEGRYDGIAGIKGKAVYLSFPVEGGLGDDYADSSDGTLHVYDFAKQKQETLVGDVSEFRLGRDGTTLLYQADRRLRVIKAGEEPEDDDAPGRASGWVDLSRVKVSIRPEAEWRQMFREAWRLQREHFWTEDMAGIDWEGVYRRYLPLVDRVTTRGEFSDLLWELLGELGTSHAYESGGAYRPRPDYRQGKLGVDWAYEDGVYRIARIVGGDRWDPEATSPLNRLGVDVRPGDAVLAVNGQPVGRDASPDERLVNQADQEVELTLMRGDVRRTVIVGAVGDEQPARYRDWVEANRARCHERSGGRIGYLHVPDMGPEGYAEFHRGFLTEYDREALVVDVRFNGGGHVSALLLQKLSRRRLGYDFPRWGVPEPYPDESPRGPMVAITNEWAGSDGDIFSHTFKLLGLGPLIGKRTWGGVIGVWPRHRLADGTVTTQPEFSFAFDDVGWRVENYGTDPDIEVDITPQDYAKGVDTQLERAIEVALERLDTHPPHTPNPAARPRLTVPRLPPRGGRAPAL
ncbi:tricorn protease [Streptosporangium becharense]|uniref:Tricorn protease homolog n=1 Tax=Streptosporangium becharense TaxID=1816182 RepID=A0A7W9ME49_9ACTN|nr:S41 family peptidase [Streptosporangium becharense]MBB2915415.1 tricorn protease [Streptosporangium becharense]MBB5817602.1 tricorn protease [Streptosporangium becharense]